MYDTVALYVHWPFCLSKCPYCDFNSHVRDSIDENAWTKALLTELEYYAARVGKRELASIFFGGGTPSLMPVKTVAAIIEKATTLFTPSANLEITLEANPTSVEASKFVSFASAGVNRVSLGVQALDDAQLSFLGRHHNVAEAKDAVALAAKHFPRFTFDLIYARPHQTLQDWRAELTEALAMAGKHLSLYQLTIEEGTAFHHAYAQQKFELPDEETSARLFNLTQELCAAHGLPAYEISNHAAPGEESRHNLVYWRSEDYLGIGPGAHGRLTTASGRVATRNLKSPERWLEQVKKTGNGLEEEEALDAETLREEWVMMGLRLAKGLRKADAKLRTGTSFDELLNPERRAFFAEQKLIEEDADFLRASPHGKLMLTSLTAALLS